MSETNFGADSNLLKRNWSSKVVTHLIDNSFWLANGFVGKGINDNGSIIHMVDQLTMSERGLSCVIPLRQPVDIDTAIVNDNQLSGKEVALEATQDEIRYDQIRFGTRDRGRITEQSTVVRFRVEARGALGDANAELVDELGFLTAAGRSYTLRTSGAPRPSSSQIPLLNFAADVTAPSSARQKFASGGSATTSLTSADKMSWAFIREVKAFAMRQRLRKVGMGAGKGWFALVMSPEQARDLRADPEYISNTQNAEVRGPDNPLWKGAFKVLEGVLLWEHNKVPNTLGAASGSKYGASGTLDGAQAIFMGAQALGYAKVANMDWYEDTEDHGNRRVISTWHQMGWLKPTFVRRGENNDLSQDFGVISMFTAAAA